MNSKIAIILFFAVSAFSGPASNRPQLSPYQGFSKIVTVPVSTPLAFVDDNCEIQSYGTSTRDYGDLGYSKLQKQRQYICLPSLKTEFASGRGLNYFANSTTYQERVVQSPLTCEGYYLLILGSYKYDKNGIVVSNGILNTSLDESHPVFVKICSGLEDTTLNKFTTAQQAAGPYVKINPAAITVDKSTYGASAYQKIYEDFLKTQKFSYETFLFVKSDNGNTLPAVIVKFGDQYWAYAMYGVWHDPEKAREYGYQVGDRLFMSEQQMTPDAGSSLDSILDRKQRYGYSCWTYQEVVENQQSIFPRLAWRRCPMWGDMSINFDTTGAAGKFYCMGDSLEIPNNPDSPENTNPPALVNLPDIDWYYGLFKKKYDSMLSTTKPEIPASEFFDYQTFMTRKMSNIYDPTQYHTDGSISPQEVTTDNPPANGSIYDANCKKLSGDDVTIRDPLGPSTKFGLKYWDWWKTKEFDVTTEVKNALSNLVSVYNYVKSNPKNASDVGLKISITNSEYADSAWYFGNPSNKYTQYNNSTEFIVFNNNYQNNSQFLKVISYNDDNTKTESYSVKKKFFFDMVWPLVYKDKFGIIRSVGYASNELFFFKEDDDRHHVYGGNDRGSQSKNKWIPMSSSDADVAEFDLYNKDSKLYHTDQYDIKDRANDSPDDMESDQVRELITNIAVAELTDFLMKQVHKLGQNDNPYIKAAGIASYELGKRIENNLAVTYTYKTAKSALELYLIWRETMDLCAQMRDTYNEMSNSWSGLKRATKNIVAYYKDFDWKSVRLTNISSVLPTANLYYMDYSINRMQQSMIDFTSSCNDMAINGDTLVVSPIVDITNKKLREAIYNNATVTTKVINQSINNLDNLRRQADQNPSKQQYISLVTRSLLTSLDNTHLKLVNDGTLGISLALKCITDESNDWVTLQKYLKTTYSKNGFDEWQQSQSNQKKVTFYPFIRHFKPPQYLFETNLDHINDWWSLSPETWDFVSVSKEIRSQN